MHVDYGNLDSLPSTTRRERIYAVLLGLLAASGSVVFIEPAPYDVLAILLFGVLSVTGLTFPREVGLPLVCLLVFLVGNVLASALALEPTETVRSLAIRVYMVFTWLLLVSLVVIEPRRMLDALWAGYIVAAVVAAVWGVLEYFNLIPGERWAGGIRAHAGFKDPNVYGPFFVPAVLLTIRRVAAGGRGRVVHFVLLCTFSLAVLLSFSRGAWINLTLSVGLFGLLLYWNERRGPIRLKWLLSTILIVAAMVSFLSALISVDVVGERFTQRAVLSQSYDLKTGGRFDTQRQALAWVATDPVGVGPGRSDEVFGLEPHNLYLHVFVESGWLGGISFFIFVGLTCVWLARLVAMQSPLRTDVFLVAASLTGLLLQSLFIDSTHWRHLWMLLAVAWALIIAHRRHTRMQALQSATLRCPS